MASGLRIMASGPASTPGLTQCGLSSPSPVAAPGPPLVPFTLNFTITNLHYTDDMKFNTTDKLLQRLVRTLPMVLDLPTLMPAPPTAPSPAH